MALYTPVNLHNVAPGQEQNDAARFDGPHREALTHLRGSHWAERFEVTPEQIMRDIPRPRRFLSVNDFNYSVPEIDLPALAPLIAQARDANLVADDTAERI